MFRNTRAATVADGNRQSSYPLDWPSSERWNPQYSVPRNSVETPTDSPRYLEHHSATPPVLSTHGVQASDVDDAVQDDIQSERSLEQEEEGLSSLSHWLETLAELYMNTLDNRARWDPRWLNVTHRERYEGLKSASITIVDYLTGESAPRRHQIVGKNNWLAACSRGQKTARCGSSW